VDPTRSGCSQPLALLGQTFVSTIATEKAAELVSTPVQHEPLRWPFHILIQ
jgi:hypothetical protein